MDKHKQQMQGLYQEIGKVVYECSDITLVEYFKLLYRNIENYKPSLEEEDPVILGITHTIKNGNS